MAASVEASVEANVIPCNSTPKQLNVIWQCNSGTVQAPLYVGLGAKQYTRWRRPSLQVQDVIDILSKMRMEGKTDIMPQILEHQIYHGLGPDSQHHRIYDHRPTVLARAGMCTATGDEAEVYFSVSTHGYNCPDTVEDHIRMPHFVWKYNSVDEKCSVILPCLDVHDFGLTVVNKKLLVVGGETDAYVKQSLSPGLFAESSSSFVDEIPYPPRRPSETLTIVPPKISRTLQVLGCTWDENGFPGMSTPRKQPAVICVQQYVVVAGGVLNGELLSSVEVLNTESSIWSQVTSVPEPVRSLTTAFCGNQLYFLGGFATNGSSCLVFTCSMESIKEFCEGSSEKVVWQKACDTPLFRSSCVVYNDELFTVGGRTSTYRTSSDIYRYDSSLDSWKLVDQQLPTSRSLPIALAAKNKLVVIGGLVQDDEPTDIIEIGTCISGMLIEYFKSLHQFLCTPYMYVHSVYIILLYPYARQFL